MTDPAAQWDQVILPLCAISSAETGILRIATCSKHRVRKRERGMKADWSVWRRKLDHITHFQQVFLSRECVFFIEKPFSIRLILFGFIVPLDEYSSQFFWSWSNWSHLTSGSLRVLQNEQLWHQNIFFLCKFSSLLISKVLLMLVEA